MLYIKETNLTTAQVKAVVESFKETIENDYYSDCEFYPHALPLAVLNLAMLDETHVKSGYTVNEYGVIYSSCNGNMVGVFEAYDDSWYFFMSGRRHGLANAMEYLPEQLVPNDYAHPSVYLSNNVDVEPTSTDVGYGTQRLGYVWTEDMSVDSTDVFMEEESTKVNNHLKSKIKGAAANYGEELPGDVIDIELGVITIDVGHPQPWAPTVTIDGIRFKAEQIVSDTNGLTLYGGKTKLVITPEDAGNNNTRIKLTRVPSA